MRIGSSSFLLTFPLRMLNSSGAGETGKGGYKMCAVLREAVGVTHACTQSVRGKARSTYLGCKCRGDLYNVVGTSWWYYCTHHDCKRGVTHTPGLETSLSNKVVSNSVDVQRHQKLRWHPRRPFSPFPQLARDRQLPQPFSVPPTTHCPRVSPHLRAPRTPPASAPSPEIPPNMPPAIM